MPGFGAAEKGSFSISPLEGIFGIPRGGLRGKAPTEAVPCGRWKVSVAGGDLPAAPGGLKGGDVLAPPGENGSKEDRRADTVCTFFVCVCQPCNVLHVQDYELSLLCVSHNMQLSI